MILYAQVRSQSFALLKVVQEQVELFDQLVAQDEAGILCFLPHVSLILKGLDHSVYDRRDLIIETTAVRQRIVVRDRDLEEAGLAFM